MKSVERALEIRKGSAWKSRDPYLAFQHRLSGPRRLLALAEGSPQKPRVKLEARRLFAVALCAAFESYWRDSVRVLVDYGGLGETPLRSLGKATFTLLDLQEVLGRKLTLGELAACSYTFQSPDVANQALSDVLGFDAFSEFKSTRFQVRQQLRRSGDRRRTRALTGITGAAILRAVPIIEQCFEVRHDTVHHVGTTFRLRREDVFRFEHAMWLFNSCMALFLSHRAPPIRKERRSGSRSKQRRVGAVRRIGLLAFFPRRSWL